ncbi:hypothetical protein MLD52_02360 [Puniceicoccaceae bacterium K14]|nr:hypothetical protein [Puniceicoccaceae bacterium K14]
MISNVQFYGMTFSLGFIISLAFRNEDETPNWITWVLLFAPLCWVGLGAFLIISVGGRSIDGVSDLLAYFDAELFYKPGGYNKAFGAIAFVFTAYFALLLTVPWRIKNKLSRLAVQSSDK